MAHRHLEVVGEAENGEVAVGLARNRRPDVVLMDVAMPVCSGVKATTRIVQLQPKCKVLALSVHTDEHSVKQMLQAGAVGYPTKGSPPDQLIRAIRMITTGKEYFFSPDVTTVQRGCSDGHSEERSLTSRETQVLRLIAAGLNNSGIATQLKLSLGQVKSCRKRIMDKLNLRSVAELTRYAIPMG